MVHFANSWDTFLSEELKKNYYQNLRKQLIQEYRRYTVYPPMQEIFQALKLTSREEVRVVILGQDPYFNPGQANGLAFSVRKGVPVPPSLQNIYKELHRDIGFCIPNHGDLTSWAMQGVLLLNTSLTVRAGNPNSHHKMGWEIFTDEVIRLIASREEPVVFLLWGNHAIKKAGVIDESRHLVLRTTHPSPLSASRGFLGSSHFSKANAFLQRHYATSIDWQIL